MKTLASCLVGFALGWGTRAVLGTFRETLVSLTAAAHGAAAAVRRQAGFEREYIEDLLAEGKARWEAERAHRAEQAGGLDDEAWGAAEEAAGTAPATEPSGRGAP